VEQRTLGGAAHELQHLCARNEYQLAVEDRAMTNRSHAGPTGLCHIGIHSKNPAALAEFYRDVLGMQVVGGSGADSPFGASTFLSSRPDEESHEIVIFADARLRHTAFRVATLGALRERYRDVVARGVAVKMALNHGVSLAFYFDDPEGNMIEIYWATGLAYGQPYGHPVDLALPEDALLRDVEQLAARHGIEWRQTLAR
jgi:catechol-2,3-dioxygenase